MKDWIDAKTQLKFSGNFIAPLSTEVTDNFDVDGYKKETRSC